MQIFTLLPNTAIETFNEIVSFVPRTISTVYQTISKQP